MDIIDPKSARGQQIIAGSVKEQPTTQGDPPPTIRAPWVYLSLGDRLPKMQRPIVFRGLNESQAHIVGYANLGDGTEIISAACDAYNREMNQARHDE